MYLCIESRYKRAVWFILCGTHHLNIIVSLKTLCWAPGGLRGPQGGCGGPTGAAGALEAPRNGQGSIVEVKVGVAHRARALAPPILLR